MDWYPQQLFTAEQAAAGVFCVVKTDMPFYKSVFFFCYMIIYIYTYISCKRTQYRM